MIRTFHFPPMTPTAAARSAIQRIPLGLLTSFSLPVVETLIPWVADRGGALLLRFRLRVTSAGRALWWTLGSETTRFVQEHQDNGWFAVCFLLMHLRTSSSHHWSRQAGAVVGIRIEVTFPLLQILSAFLRRAVAQLRYSGRRQSKRPDASRGHALGASVLHRPASHRSKRQCRWQRHRRD